MTRLATLPIVVAALLGGLPVVSAQPMPPPASRDGSRPAATPPLPTATIPAPIEADRPQPVSLSASLSGDARPIRNGVAWRIFAERGAGATLELVDKPAGATPTVTLPPGAYVVHVSYGLASTTKRIVVGAGPSSERLALDAGALRLGGAIGDVPIPENRLSFSIYQPLPNDPEGRLVAANVKAGEVIRMPTGGYHVVSNYGESNAIMRVDLKVDRGKLTDATLNHRAATVTLKLVQTTGGEAFAGTAFSILTPGGDVIREAIGAFPSVTLAEGDYVLIARNNGKVYTREFKIESGLNQDVELMVAPG